MTKKGLDYDKLNKFQEKFDNHSTEIIRQLEDQLKEFGEIIKKETGILPDSKSFCNWMLDNYTHVITKKRRLPFVLEKKYIIEYCLDYKIELENNITEQEHNLTFIKSDVDNQPQKGEILVILQELFENRITEELFYEILEETSFILHNETIHKSYVKVLRRVINLKHESLSYAFHLIYSLKKEPKIKILITDYLHKKFETFGDTTITTIRTKFSPKRPDTYPW